MERARRYCVARGASYPSFSIPDFMPFTVPCVGRGCYLVDPAGVLLGLHEYHPDA